MARMTREFSLVLVGSGILTAGYFLYPEDDIEARQKEQVAFLKNFARQVGTLKTIAAKELEQKELTAAETKFL